MPHTCPHCSAIFDQWHDICPSCNRSMFRRGLLATILHAIFKPKRHTMSTTATTMRGPSSRITRSSTYVFDDGSGKREWSNWGDIPPEIRSKIESLGGGPGAKEGTLTSRTSSGSISLTDLPPDLRAKLDELRGDRESATIELSGSSTFHETERRRGDVLIDRSSSNTAKYRYEDSDGTVHEAERLEDLPPHVQALIRKMSRFGQDK